LALIVAGVVAVPLLVLAAWFYLEREHILPGANASPRVIEQSSPSPIEQHGDSVPLPQASDPTVPSKPNKKTDSGKRSELVLPSWSGGVDSDSGPYDLAIRVQS
jgi:hypothetical protein